MTVQEIFDIAIRLMDAQNEGTGSTDTVDTKEYRVRACSLLNSVLDLVYPASDTYPGAGPGGARPVCPKVSALTDVVAVDGVLAAAVLPYALAALFLSQEDGGLANFFQQAFEERLVRFQRQRAAESARTEDLYGGVEHGGFGRWI